MSDEIAIDLQPPEALSTLKRFTNARIALGRSGVSLPIKAQLEFQLAHALARDAVSIPLDFTSLAKNLKATGYNSLILQSQAENHHDFLQRPDKGRLLNFESIEKLDIHAQQKTATDIVIIIADGLSSKAIEKHALAFVHNLTAALHTLNYSVAPICLVKYGRVAIGDHIGELLKASMSIVLIGERPGLSSADSMGIYFTYQPLTGKTDSDRNCISNIHQDGLDYETAKTKLIYLINQAKQKQYSGVLLKDETEINNAAEPNLKTKNFLLS